MTGRSKVALDDYALDAAFLINAQIYLLYQQSYANISGMKHGSVAMSKIQSLRIEVGATVSVTILAT
jgi:hypothetical protein